MSNIDFSKPLALKMEDKEYFNIGNIDINNPTGFVMSASLLKSIHTRDLYDVLVLNNKEYGKELRYTLDLGSAFHCFCLEKEFFDKRYYADSFENKTDDRIFIKISDFLWIKKAHEHIKLKYPYILDDPSMNEIVVIGTIRGIPAKCKIDKIIENNNELIIIDLKSIFMNLYSTKFRRNKEGIRWNLIRYIQEVNYDLQGYFYATLVEEYLKQNKKDKSVTFKLLFADKDEANVALYSFSQEMIQHGELKFNTLFPAIKDFYENGEIWLPKEEIL
jgi:hypothetical protein